VDVFGSFNVVSFAEYRGEGCFKVADVNSNRRARDGFTSMSRFELFGNIGAFLFLHAS
jgi:hypothetical protein